jgi:glutamyl-tRNA synthetase/glutamyl-Q tRNA(Asp) synthetase
VNAIYVWGLARALGGRVLLRIEDHDRLRSRPEYEAALLDDLDWLGFSADQGRNPPLRQSDDDPAYAAALDRLRATHHVYACDCSRRDIGGERYPGTCRTRGIDERAGRGVRVQIESGQERFIDGLLGEQMQTPAEEYGDLLIRDRDGHWTYQFAVTVDDMRQGVTAVIRGTDLLSSAGRQVRLAHMLGRAEPPVFVHHPLVWKSPDQKLSKSDGDTGVRELRAAGVTPDDVIGRAAAAVGLLDAPRPISAHRVAELFM